MSARWKLVLALTLPSIVVIAAIVWQIYSRAAPNIRIGVLHSLSGTMAQSEKPLVDAVRLAVEEINAQGGLLGRKIEIVVADGKSDSNVFAAEAERLISEEKISALFACWTSACRKAVKPVVERHRHLLFYPLQYEGLEQSPNIIYTGSAPNQQIVPGTRWAVQKFGPRIYLVGSDYVFPRTANIIIRDLVAATGGEILAERYVPLGDSSVAEIIADIRRKKPDVVLNTLNGDSNAAFFSGLLDAGLATQPLVSFSVAEGEMQAWGGDRLDQHYGVWSYFQSLPQAENQRFVAAWQTRFGVSQPTSDPVEAAYVGVLLWAQTVRDVGSSEPGRVNPALLRQTIRSPSGIAAVDAQTRHLWKALRIGKVRPGGQFEQVTASNELLRPAPWPHYRSREAWDTLIRASAREELP